MIVDPLDNGPLFDEDEDEDLFFNRDTEEGAEMSERMMRGMQIVVGVITVVVVVGIVAIGGALTYSYYKSWEIDYLNHKAMVQIIRYNLEQGKLVPVPPAAPVPAVPPAPTSNVPSPSDPHPAEKK